MKWEIIDNTPILGETRSRVRFAWWPTRVLSKITMTDHVVWLQLYLEEQVYTATTNDGWEYFEYWKTVAKTIHI